MKHARCKMYIQLFAEESKRIVPLHGSSGGLLNDRSVCRMHALVWWHA